MFAAIKKWAFGVSVDEHIAKVHEETKEDRKRVWDRLRIPEDPNRYPSFKKIPRLYKDVCISEKIDGTNGVIQITESGGLRVGSRNRWLSADDDNHGFFEWASQRSTKLLEMGPGIYYGEFYGKGIQRGYGLDEKRFALFPGQKIRVLPSCCEIVPILYSGKYSAASIFYVMEQLKQGGSVAVPGYMKPEGAVLFHSQSRQSYKVTIGENGKYE